MSFICERYLIFKYKNNVDFKSKARNFDCFFTNNGREAE